MTLFYSAIACSLVLLWPFVAGAAWYLRGLYGTERVEKRLKGSRERLSLVRVLYLVGVLGLVIQSVLASIAILALAGQRELVAHLAPAVYAALPILGALPIPAALYLRWLGRAP